jgi:hypothetical protein
MAFASLSPEVVSSKIMRDLGLSLAVMSAMTGIEKTKLSYALRQLKELSPQDAEKLKPTLLRLQEIAVAIHPFRLNVQSATDLQFMVDEFAGLDGDQIAARVRVVFSGDGYDL